MFRHYRHGIVLAFATAVFSGVANTVNKVAVAGVGDPLVHTAAKNAVVGLVLIGVLTVSHKWSVLRSLNRSQWLRLIAIGVIGGSLPFYLFFTALSRMPAINASLIHKSLFLWVGLLAVPLLGERIRPVQWMGIGLVVAANYFMGSFTSFRFGTNEWMVLTATMFWAVEQIIAKRVLREIDPDLLAGARMVIGSLVLLAAVAVTGRSSMLMSLTPSQWGMVLVTSFLLTGYVLTWYRALRTAPATVVATVLVVATVVTNVTSGIFLTHTLPLVHVREGILLIIGVLLVVFGSGRRLSRLIPAS